MRGATRNKGAAHHPLYRIWCGIIQRCFNENNPGYSFYGAKGVKMCDEWVKSFYAFAEHIGERPSKFHTVDRFPNKSGNYEPGNVRWATKGEQSRNTKNNNIVEFNGEKMCLTDWADKLGIKYCTLYNRIHELNWPLPKALTTTKIMNARNQYTKTP